ncbi:DUF1822 family protein [Trichocoleus desertorum AS-A10]|uniref:DUF1822 family protein n=1 Tax=Trichocoleus desertorum TaxID=1481672 RepID=UPI0032975843
MSDILSALTTLYPDQVWLELSPLQLEQTELSQQEYSYDVARWTAFKNCLALDAFLAWLKAESFVSDQPEVWPSRDDLSSIWEMVNGTAIQLGETRIVLIPHEGIDINEFEVQAEWVDIPSWVADYYLAVQVNPDDCWLRIWGYATHKKLKQAGQYNRIRRTYSLEREELIEDVNVMWVARELGCDRKAVVKPLPTLSPAQAERLLKQLSQKTSYSPRLEVPFENWGSLLALDEWRQALYNRRCMISAIASSKQQVNLSRWLQKTFEAGWQTLETLLSTESLNLAIARSIEQFRKIEAPHSGSSVSAGKLIDMGLRLGDQRVVLIVAITPALDKEVNIRVRVCPTDSQTYLPPGLQLTACDPFGATSPELEASARSDDNWIQLEFSGELGENFSIKVTLEGVSVAENFVI